MFRRRMFSAVAVTLVLVWLAVGSAGTIALGAEPPIVIGVSASLTGYLADLDRSLMNGVTLAVETVNAQGGILGRPIQLVVEDIRSEPQQAVTAVRKLIVSDRAHILLSGFSSAGNAAAATLSGQYRIPAIIASVIAPTVPPNLARWLFSTIPQAEFEVTTRYAYLAAETDVRKVGVLFDPTPYANLQREAALREADRYGLTVVGVEQYQSADTDLRVQLTKLQSAGAEAILKLGAGPSIIVAAKNMTELNMRMPLLASFEDLGVLRPAAEAYDNLYFVAPPPQVYDALPDDSELKASLRPFMEVWRERHPNEDPSYAGRGWDAIMLAASAIESTGSLDGEQVRTAVEGIRGFAGTSGLYNYSPESHYGFQVSPYVVARIQNGDVVIVHGD